MSPESYYQREHLVLERLVSTEGQTFVNQSFALLIFCNQAGLISERKRDSRERKLEARLVL